MSRPPALSPRSERVARGWKSAAPCHPGARPSSVLRKARCTIGIVRSPAAPVSPARRASIFSGAQDSDSASNRPGFSPQGTPFSPAPPPPNGAGCGLKPALTGRRPRGGRRKNLFEVQRRSTHRTSPSGFQNTVGAGFPSAYHDAGPIQTGRPRSRYNGRLSPSMAAAGRTTEKGTERSTPWI